MKRKRLIPICLICLLMAGCTTRTLAECVEMVRLAYPGFKILSTIEYGKDDGAPVLDYERTVFFKFFGAYYDKERDKCVFATILVNRIVQEPNESRYNTEDVKTPMPLFELEANACNFLRQ